jgi:hypothetical protein
MIKTISNKKVKKEALVKSYNNIGMIIEELYEYTRIYTRERKIKIDNHEKDLMEWKKEQKEEKYSIYNFWMEKNKPHEEKYSEEFLRLTSRRGLYIDDIEKIFPENFCTHLQVFFKEIFEIKKIFRQKIL